MQIIQCFTLAIWLLWFLIYWRGGTRALADIQKSIQGANLLDAVLMLTIGIGSLALAVGGLPIALGWTGNKENLQIEIVGLFLTLTGAFGTFYCRRFLGGIWTAETSLPPNRQIVDSGPYGIVRHPIYSAVIVMYLGIALALPAWWTAFFSAAVILSYAFKAQLEDKFLAAELKGYREYQAKVRFRLIPGLW